jgi:hypothetical protein
VASILKDHVTLEVKRIDRLYLNAYAPPLQNTGAHRPRQVTKDRTQN